ncbi:MAG: tetratricopeptide repeat protein [Sideroxydans sp.]|jgi:TPR repeat protein
MIRITQFLFVASITLLTTSAHASSCDPNTPPKLDPKIALYNESNCALRAMDTAHKHTRDAATAESKSDTRRMCEANYAALGVLEKYQAGDWRANYKEVAAKVDAQYAETQARFIKTTCPQKLDLYRHLANKGDAWAMYNMGVIYAKGNGVPQSDDVALTWYMFAAEKGNLDAYLALGKMYSDGAAFKPDYAIALDWYTKAASAGDAGAQYTVASMYRKGLGAERDANKAVEWYKKAAQQKHQDAKAKLEEMYKAGEAKRTYQ